MPFTNSYLYILSEELKTNANQKIIVFDPIAKINIIIPGLYFFVIYKFRSPGKYTPLYKSDVKPCSHHGDLHWNRVFIGSTDLCNDNYH